MAGKHGNETNDANVLTAIFLGPDYYIIQRGINMFTHYITNELNSEVIPCYSIYIYFFTHSLSFFSDNIYILAIIIALSFYLYNFSLTSKNFISVLSFIFYLSISNYNSY